MIKGRYGDTTNAPYVGGLVIIPGVARGHISFLVDTGADKAVIMPPEAALLGIDHSKLRQDVVCKGVGGDAYGEVKVGKITFRGEDNSLFTYQVEIIILQPTNENKDMTSLLGRDIISRWRAVFDYPTGAIEFEADSSDNMMRPLNPPRRKFR